ncbi:MAG: biopolymer transporter ExbD [Gammaproteobacteria bacterium]|jgi:biopolymer transport protein ExbD
MSRRRRKQHDTAELNITAFMNLMVILVPFLLITAVFSRLAILELNLPTSQVEEQDDSEPEFMLEITVRDASIEVGDRNQGMLTNIESDGEDYDLEKLSEYLVSVKEKFPTKTDATLLLEQDIAYEVLVQVMDTVRVVEELDEEEQVFKAELFPEISIGDAPVLN